MEEAKYKLSEIAPLLENFLGAALRGAGLDLSFELSEGQHRNPGIEDPEVVVKFSGADVAMVLANRSELLLALEQLSLEVLRVPGEDHSRICFDANDWRMLRIEELRLTAAVAADRVRQTGAPFHFSPMSSRERRILHLSLRGQEGVRSESTGLGPIRQVVIVPADMKTVPDPIRPPAPRDEPARGGFRRDGPRRDGPGHGGPRRSGPHHGRR